MQVGPGRDLAVKIGDRVSQKLWSQGGEVIRKVVDSRCFLRESLGATKRLRLGSVTGGSPVNQMIVDLLGPGWSRFIWKADKR